MRNLSLLTGLLAVLVSTPTVTLGAVIDPTDRVMIAVFSGQNPKLPHPAFEGARITLKGVVRNATCGTYRVQWDVNRNGNYDDDPHRDVGRDGTTGMVRDIGRTFVVPNVPRDSSMNLSVRVRNLCTNQVKYGSMRLFVYDFTPSEDPRNWTHEQIEIMALVAVQESLWYVHRKLTAFSYKDDARLAGYQPYRDANPLAVWLMNINGHQPAFPPGTLQTFGQPVPEGWHAANDDRWHNDLYAETNMRMVNDMLNLGSHSLGIPGGEEDNACGYNPNGSVRRCNRIAGTNDNRGAEIGGAHRRGGHYTNYVQGMYMGSLATVLPAVAGTRIQTGDQRGQPWNWYQQQLVDYMGANQIDGGCGKGAWLYHDHHGDGNCSTGDGSSTQWAYIGLESSEIAGGPYGVFVNNRHKYRIADNLLNNQQADGGGAYRSSYGATNFQITGGAFVASRWLDVHHMSRGDGRVPYPNDSGINADRLRHSYDRYIQYTLNNWHAVNKGGSIGWLDGLWYQGDYLCGDTSGVYEQQRCGNTYAMYSHQKGYRTGVPELDHLGDKDWYRQFNTYYLRAQDRTVTGDPLGGYDTFGRIYDTYCTRWSVTCGYGSGYLGSAMGALVLTPTVFNPRPVAVLDALPTSVAEGCVGGNAGKVTFDHGESFHPNAESRIVVFQIDYNAGDGLWWETGAPPDYEVDGETGSLLTAHDHVYERAGHYLATLRVVDNVGLIKTNSVDITVTPAANVPPAAGAGGNYGINVGQPLQLRGNASDQNTGCGDAVSVAWDLDGDNQFDDAFSVDPLVPWGGWLANVPLGQPHTVRIRVRDSAGLEAIDEGTVTVYAVDPEASGVANPNPASCGLPVTFDGSASLHRNPNREVTTFDWDVDGVPGFEGTGQIYTHVFPQYGTYRATLRVTDDAGGQAVDTFDVTVNQGNLPPVARIAKARYTVLSGDALVLDGRGSTDPNLGCGDSLVSYRWDIDGNGRFDDLGTDGVGPTPTIPWAVLAGLRGPADPQTNLPRNEIRLQVTDSFGLTHVATAEVVILDAQPRARVVQDPRPTPINLVTGLTRAVLDGRESSSPVPGLEIVQWDWDLDDNGTYEAHGPTVEFSKTFRPVPPHDNIPAIFVRLRVTDATGRTAEARHQVALSLPPTPPTADADPSDVPEIGYHILEGEGVKLIGSQSYDPDFAEFGDFIVRYAWDIGYDAEAGFVADEEKLDENGDAQEATVELTAGRLAELGVAGPGTYPIALEVEDQTELINVDESTITVHPRSPIASLDASLRAAACGQRVTFDASASKHPHPKVDIVSYAWDLDGNGEYGDAFGAVVQNAFDHFEHYTVGVEVTDINGNTARASVEVDVNQGNRPPVPVAGGYRAPNGTVIGPYTMKAGDSLRFDATGSADPDASCGDRIVRYQWDIGSDGDFEIDTNGPVAPQALSWAQLQAAGVAGVGQFVVRLRITDSFGATSEGAASIRVVNGPTAVAQVNPNRAGCQQAVTLDGSASFSDGPTDQGFQIVRWEWDLDGDGQYDDAEGAFTQQATQGSGGHWSVGLRVTDAGGRTATTTTDVLIDTQNLRPVARAGGPYSTGPTNTSFLPVRLDGRASVDPNHPCDSVVRYKWDTDGDGRYGLDDNPPDLEGAVIDGHINPDWRVNTVHVIRLIVCDSLGACSDPAEAPVEVQGESPPKAEFVAPRADEGGCVGPGNLDVALRVSDATGDEATINIVVAGRQVAQRTVNLPPNGQWTDVHIPINSALVPEGRHKILVFIEDENGGETELDSGGRITFDRTPPALNVSPDPRDGLCYNPDAIPDVVATATDLLDPTPIVGQLVEPDGCGRRLSVTATDACGNESRVERTYLVGELATIVFDGAQPDELLAEGSVTWQAEGPAQCVSNIRSTVSLNGGPALPYPPGERLTDPGTYTVTLGVSDCRGTERAVSRRFRVNAPPVAVPIPEGHPAADPERADAYVINEGAQLKVDGSDSEAPEDEDAIVDWAWDFNGDGTIDARGKKVDYPTDQQGTFIGTLTVKDTFGRSDTASFRVTVRDVVPIPDPGGPYVVFQGQALTVDASASRPGTPRDALTRYVWSWDDGSPDTDGALATHAWDDAGTYNVRLTVYDSDSSATAVVRVDVRQISPIISGIDHPELIEVLPMQFTVNAVPGVETDPLTLYTWDMDGDNVPEYEGPDASTIVHQYREAGVYRVTARVRDTDSVATKSIIVVVREATLGALASHLQDRVDAAIADDTQPLLARLALAELQLTGALPAAEWAERNGRRGVTMVAMADVVNKVVEAQALGMDFGDELFALSRQFVREVTRHQRRLLDDPLGPGFRDPSMVKAAEHVAAVVEVYNHPNFELDVYRADGAYVAQEVYVDAHPAFRWLAQAEQPFVVCEAAALDRVADPRERQARLEEQLLKMTQGLEALQADVDDYLQKADADPEGPPAVARLNALTPALQGLVAAQQQPFGRICARGQTCASDPHERAYVDHVTALAPKLEAAGAARAFTDVWEDAIAQARECRLELYVRRVIDVGAPGAYANGLPRRTKNHYMFELDGPADVTLFTGDGVGGCAVDTRLSVHRVTLGGSEQVAFNDDFGFQVCSRIDASLPAGRYEVIADAFGGLPVNSYTLNVEYGGAEACGDGALNPEEECDDGNLANGDGCNARCVVEPTDLGGPGDYAGGGHGGTFDRFAFTAAQTSALTAFTHDGMGGCPGDTRMRLIDRTGPEPVEIAFDDNGGAGACSRIERRIEAGRYELVVEGVGALPPYRLNLTLDPIDLETCGNGRLDDGEQCDDGNNFNGDGCGHACTLEAQCGNNVVEPTEACDDGNRAAGDGCSPTCQVEAARCGNGRVEAGETCDDGNLANGDGCDALCARESIAFVDSVETRDGALAANSAARYTFTADTASRLRVEIGDGAGGCPGDTTLKLTRLDGFLGASQVAFDDDGGVDGCSLLNLPVVQAGRYEIEVAAFGGVTIDDYTITFRLVARVHNGQRYTGRFEEGGDDRYAFEVLVPTALTLTTSDGAGGCPVDTRITLYRANADGSTQQITSADGGAVGPCALLRRDLPAGSYEAVVAGGNGAAGAYQLGVALEAIELCGNGQVDNATEECDDGNRAGGDGCDAECLLECGNGRVDAPLEACDDGNRINGDGCSNRCEREQLCGNGVMNPGEQCDDGNQAGGDGCDANCALECGNGRIDGNEACDDGNRQSADGCSATCAIEAQCGDGQVQAGEQCDGGEGCDNQCRLTCGNQRIDAGEQCDDGNQAGGDGCDADCQIEAGCGDGAVQGQEECDDGNNRSGDGCSATCRVERPCGNGRVDAGEACDDGNNVNGDGCDTLCSEERYTMVTGRRRIVGSVPNGAVDVVTFTADDDSSTFEATLSDGEGGCPGPARLAVVRIAANGAATEVAASQNGGPANCAAIRTPVLAGRYELRVQGLADVAGYQLDAKLFIDATAGGRFNGATARGGDDLLVVQTGGGSYTVSTGDGAGGCTQDTFIKLYRVDGGTRELVAQDDDGTGTLCARLDRVLEAGTYEYEVHEFGRNALAAYVIEVDGAGSDCGNGVVEPGEQCDGGAGCDANCRLQGVCGNGIIEGAEACDGGPNCNAACELDGVCGNGVVEGNEDCDDGNLLGGDGCNALCEAELDDYTITTGEWGTEGAISQGGQDTFHFTVDGMARLTAQTSSPGGGCTVDTYMELYRVQGNSRTRVTQNDDFNGTCSRINRALNAGNYEVVVTGFGNTAIASYRFDFRLEVDVTNGGQFLGGFPQGGNDLFELSVAVGGVWQFQTSDGEGACPGDTEIVIFRNDEGARTQVAAADDGGPGACAALAPNLEAGYYEIVVSGPAAVPNYLLLAQPQ